MFRKSVLWLVLLLLLSSAATALEGWPPPYQGVAIANVTVRSEASSKAKKIGDARTGELLNILSLEGDWLQIEKDGQWGYVLASQVRGIHETSPGYGLVAAYAEDFEPLYTGVATAQLSLRSEQSRDSKQISTVYANDMVLIGELGEEWSYVRSGKHEGYVLSEYLTSLKVINPYWASLPGAYEYPYMARVIRPTWVVEADTGEPLQELPSGALVNVQLPEQGDRLLLPYKRTWGTIAFSDVELLQVFPWENAQPGELIGSFATFFPHDPQNEVDAGRLHNIQMGVTLLDGLRITAGAEFSFNAIAAPYTQANGYRVGPIVNYVSDKKTGYGGGICQVSTTLYNLLLQLPMRIITTRPHSSVGIDYAPVNYDAAVGKGNLDLVFQNMLPYDVEMQLSSVDGVVTVLMYRAQEG